LNFGNPEKPERMGELIRCCDGLYFAANAYKIPYVSGNVSLYNEGLEGPIAPTPTILGVGIVADVRKAVTADLKEAGNVIYLVGETMQEMGGSEYYRLLGLTGGSVPKVYPEKTQKSMSGLLKAMDKKLVRSCHDLSAGGLLVAAAEMAFGGDLGLDLDIRNIGGMRTDYKLFSESNSRWLVEVREKDAADFESMVLGRRVGVVTKETELKIKDSGIDLKYDLAQLRDAWDSAIGREKE
jgi:phosphoribosylformylglycinamidine synthase